MVEFMFRIDIEKGVKSLLIGRSIIIEVGGDLWVEVVIEMFVLRKSFWG